MRFRPVLVLAAAASLLLAACGDDDSSSDDEGTTATTTSAPAETTMATTPSTTAAPASGPASLAVAEVEGVGEALVDAEGFTLYLFEMDQGTTTACTGGCADAWPAAVADGEPVAGDGVDPALLETADGQEPNQLVYNGHLLYLFSGDQAPGDANGVGLPGWYPVDAAGDAVEA